MATLEEASHCPRCGEVGIQGNVRLLGARGKLIQFDCRNTRCKWYNQPGWSVQVRKDGTVPDPDTTPRGNFPALDNEVGKRMVENLEGLLLESEKQGREK